MKKKALYLIRKDAERKLFTIEHSLQVPTLGSVFQKLYYSLYIKGFHCITRVG